MKKVLLITTISLFILGVSLFFTIRKKANIMEIEKIDNIVTNNIVKDLENTIWLNDNILGILEIPTLQIKAIVKNGTDIKTLNNYLGHFENSSFEDGNICIAGHNSGFIKNYFSNLHKINIGEEITYKTINGIKKYKVTKITEIDENDWALLDQTKNNTITLITCVFKKPEKRLCVTAEI